MSYASFIQQLEIARELADDILALQEQIAVKDKLLKEVIGAGVVPEIQAQAMLHNAQKKIKTLTEEYAHADLIDKVVALLRLNEGIPMNARQVAELLGEVPRIASIHSMMVRKSNKGIIQKTNRGQYVWLPKSVQA